MNFWEKQRLSLGVSQRQLAMKLGVANQTVSSWEADDSLPSTTIAELARAYEVSETVIERELIGQRRRMEKRSAASAG